MANSYSSALRGSYKQQASSNAKASIDEDRQNAYRDGGVEQVKVGSRRRVAAGGSSTGDLDTRSAGTTDVPMHAAESAGCGFPPAADVDPLDLPARPPAAHIARDDSIPSSQPWQGSRAWRPALGRLSCLHGRDQIPHLLQVADPVTTETYKLLCVITGRKPLFEMQTCRSLSSGLHYALLWTSRHVRP